MDAHLALQIGWRQGVAVFRMSLTVVSILCIPLVLIGIALVAFFSLMGTGDESGVATLWTWLKIAFWAHLIVALAVSPYALLTGIGLGLWAWATTSHFDPFTIRQQLRWRAFSLGMLSTWALVGLFVLLTGQRADLWLWLFSVSGAALLTGVLAVAAVDDVADWYQRAVPLRKRKLEY